jgi:NADH dehydrogenase FAD-containing subunit
VFKQGVLESINPKKNTISIRGKGASEAEEVDYDYLALCTGSTYSSPIKDNQEYTLEERKSGLEIEKEAVKRAQSILVVGGGSVGVEMIGELCDLNAKII